MTLSQNSKSARFFQIFKGSFFSDLSEVDWYWSGLVRDRGSEDIIDFNRVFSSFYAKLNDF